MGVTNGGATFRRAIDKFVDEENLTIMFVYLNSFTVTGSDQAKHDKCVKRFLEVGQRQKLAPDVSKPIISANKISVLGYEIGDELVGQIWDYRHFETWRYQLKYIT